MSVAITTEAVSKRYGDHAALSDVSIAISPGQLAAVVGPSGCGKSTLLRLLAGFAMLDSGTIRFDGVAMEQVPPEVRPTGLMFQHYALWPHLRVFDHLAYGLRVRRWDRQRIAQRVAELLELVGLSGLERRFPGQLSGGQQQRVALARCLAVEPGVLLLDEPLSNLDAEVRAELRTQLRALQQRIGTTMIYVTHDQEEALSLADQLIVLQNGSVAQAGPPAALYQHPASPFVARFVGRSNLLHGTLSASTDGLIQLTPPDRHDLALSLPVRSWAGSVPPTPGQDVVLVCKPEHIHCTTPGAGTALDGAIIQASFRGPVWVVLARTAWGEVELSVPTADWQHLGQHPGDVLPLHIDSDHALLFPATL